MNALDRSGEARSRLEIWIVEDDPGHALLVERALRRAGMENPIRTFEDGAGVLEALDPVGARGIRGGLRHHPVV